MLIIHYCHVLSSGRRKLDPEAAVSLRRSRRSKRVGLQVTARDAEDGKNDLVSGK